MDEKTQIGEPEVPGIFPFLPLPSRTFCCSGKGWFQAEEIGEETEDDAAQTDEGFQAFLNLAGDDGELDAEEVRNILNQVFQKGAAFLFCFTLRDHSRKM